ncbi:MAG: ABC transporter ATP-binding protein [Spirochaetaceae bacterium]|jgi:oligopeptide/dipeptide ABC transporter ATP-binding protein|nr:ABC transporter ATP-binding protein [Spirochaetaceae bacterium]
MLEVRDLKKYFALSGGRRIRAVDGVSLRVQENEILGIVGESGCGKSTLGRLILRLIEPDAGQVYFGGEEITCLSRSVLRPKRRTMQMVFQNPFSSFNPKIRIGAALMEVCRYYGMSIPEGRERIERLLRDIGLSSDLLNRWPGELSGGQLQRLAIARAIIAEPSLLIADEPLSALDVSVQAQLLNLLDDLRASRSMAMIFISHDMTVVEYFCGRVAVMYLGVIMELITAAELSRNALHPYTRSLRASAPRLDVFKDSVEESATPIHGETPNPHVLIKGCPFAPRCPQAQPFCTDALPELREASPGHWVRCSLF